MKAAPFLLALWVALGSGLTPASELTDEVHACVDRLIGIIDADLVAPVQDGNLTARLWPVKMSLQQAVVNDSSDELSRVLSNSVSRGSALSPAFMDAWSDANLANAKARKKQREKKIARLMKLRDRIGETVLQAETAADLDELMDEIRQAEGVTGDSTNKEEVVLRKIFENAERFVGSWQDYLFYTEQSNFSKAEDKFGRLTSNAQLFLNRSEVLKREHLIEEERRAHELTVDFVLDRVSRLDDLTPFFDEWQQLSSRERFENTDSHRRLIQKLTRIATAYQSFQAGLPFEVGFLHHSQALKSTSVPADGLALVAKLERDFAKAAIPSHLGLRGDHSRIDGNSLSEYFDSLSEFCRAKGELEAVERIEELRGNLGMIQQKSPMDQWGIRHYNSALRSIEAKRPRMAVQCLHSALRTGSALLPTERIRALLAELEEAHPEEYRLALTDPYPEPATPSAPAAGKPLQPPSLTFILSGNLDSEEVERVEKAVRGNGGVVELKLENEVP